MNNVIRLACCLVILSMLVGGTMACQLSSPSNLDEEAIRAYADPAVETTMQGLSENNLAKYVQYGNAEFKAAVTQEMLNNAYEQIGSQLGAYESKEFLRIEEQQGYIIVHYRVNFANKDNVGIRMVFDKDHLVAGQWFE